ncbi:restriction endonuclease subunit S [Aquipseudomonas alcaligenes]|uniref:Restriction endonuclease subunit S n=1 Tax=Aquipseudomonas alcaligenes TaxID=43263 RepID=A0AA42N3S7_AQUAC|nr:restriction endonuclease subunit S [Pseudomonas alcaligenes]MDH1055984.1 restriction endonuclease subunit S [Pseudomonas alcaligenes]
MNLVPFGSVCSLQNGRAFKPEEWSASGTPIVRIQNLNDETKPFNYCNFEVEKRFHVDSGDLLFSWSGTPGTSFGAFFWNRGKGFLNQHIFRVDIDERHIDKNYLRYAINSKLDLIIDQAHGGVGLKHITKGKLEAVEIPLPPLPEQKRIAAILDKADAIRRKRQQAIQLADDFLRAVFLDMFGDPVTNPKGFPIGTIRDLVATADYGSSAKASETYGEYPILRMGNITYQGRIDLEDLKYINLEEKEKSKYLVKKGDLLFNRTNSKELVGKTAVYDKDDPVAIAGYLIRVRPNEMGDSHYISGYLNSAHGKATLRSICKSIVGMANINAQEMQSIPIMLPSIELQRNYQKLVVATRCKLQAFDAALKLAEQAFNSLSYKAFSGQL